MVQSPSREANWFAASQEIPRILWLLLLLCASFYNRPRPSQHDVSINKN